MIIYEKLMNIQTELKATKDLFNTFGNYAYRSAESILEALKPLMIKYKAALLVSDDVVLVGDRYYIKAIARLQDTESDAYVETIAFAREEENKKGQDSSQTTGSTSSYARKYALNGLFAIDDNKDSDSTNKHGKEAIKEDADKEDVKTKLGKMIMDLANNDKAKAKTLFKTYTSFKGKDGNIVEGKDSMAGMSDKAIQATYGKVKVDWLKLQNKE